MGRTSSVSGAVAVDPAELGGDATSRGSRTVSRDDLLETLTCPISGKVLVDPISTPCGHSMSRSMLARWMTRPGQAPSCPTCRAPLYHDSPHTWPVNTVLAELTERFLPEALAEAQAEAKSLSAAPLSARADGSFHLPLFVLDAMTPGQELTLNVFEERYKVMVRRVLQTTRKFGMVGTIAPEEEDGAGGERRGDGALSNRFACDAESESSGPSGPNLPRAVDSAETTYTRRRGDFRFSQGVAFADYGVECVVVAHQEMIDGRVLVRCRAVRRVEVLESADDPAGYVVARCKPSAVVPTTNGAATRSLAADAPDAGEPVEARGRARRVRGGVRGGGGGAPRGADAVAAAAYEATLADSPASASNAEYRTRLLGERAVAMHQVWLARVTGRPPPTRERAFATDDDDDDDDDTFPPPPPTRFPAPRRDFLRRSYGGDVDTLLAASGTRPPLDRPEDLSWWLVRVANPLPPLGAALELRSAALGADSPGARFAATHRRLAASMRAVHGVPPEKWRGVRPLAAAVVAAEVLRALEGGDGNGDPNRSWAGAFERARRGLPGEADPAEGRRDAEDYARLVRAVGRIVSAVDPRGEFTSPEFSLPTSSAPASSLPPVRATASLLAPHGPARREATEDDFFARLDGVGFAPPPDARAEENVLAVVRAGGCGELCWRLYLALDAAPEREFERACSYLGDALFGFPDRGRGGAAEASARREKSLPPDFPRPGDGETARAFWAESSGWNRRRRFRAVDRLARSRVGRFAGRAATCVLAAVTWCLAALGHAALLFFLSVGLGAEAVVERRALPAVAKGCFITAVAVALFGVLSYVPS
jgi:hypothetical protein